jgi:hypothetical protein
MPKRKANWWPPSILSDPDVLSVDDEGRFVLCKICHVHYAVHGGKKPKPVIMNSNFRTRAWDVHKERTNSHRLQKQQERLQQAKQQQATQPATDSPAQQPQKPQIQPVQTPQQQRQALQSQAQGKQKQQQQRLRLPAQPQAKQTQAQSQSMAALATQAQTLTQAPPHQVQRQAQALAPPTQQQQQQPPPQQTPTPPSTGETQTPQRRQQQQQDLDETKDARLERLHAAARNSATEQPTSAASPQSITTVAMSGPGSTSVPSNGASTASGKRSASAMPVDTPAASRRRVFHAGSPGSSMQLIAESEAARRAASEKHSFMAAGNGSVAKRAPAGDQAFAMEQADSSARWRHMHDDVSRALNAAPRRRQQAPASYTSGELRAAKTLAQTETGDLGGNNSERVAKKLRSLNAEYRASNMRHADGNNMRHDSVRGEVFDRRSAGYKEYWGTLRDVYTSSSGGSGSRPAVSLRKAHHRSNPSAAPIQEESKETEADSTTPDDYGSSEDAFKPALVVHDATLLSAIERLTEATTKQIASLYQKETSGSQEALAGLTSVMKDLRVQHGDAFGRIIELQEKHLKVMEAILQVKLRKEAARDTQSSRNSNGSTSGSSSGNSTDKAARSGV